MERRRGRIRRELSRYNGLVGDAIRRVIEWEGGKSRNIRTIEDKIAERTVVLHLHLHLRQATELSMPFVNVEIDHSTPQEQTHGQQGGARSGRIWRLYARGMPESGFYT